MSPTQGNKSTLHQDIALARKKTIATQYTQPGRAGIRIPTVSRP